MNKTQFPPARILAPIDFSKPSLAALAAAKALARRWGSSLELAYVQELPLSLLGFTGDEGLGMPGLIREIKDFRRWRLDELRRAGAGLADWRARVVSGVPAEQILKLSRGRGIGLVVMGTHGHTGRDRVLFGSVTEAVVRHCGVPVLTVHRDAAPGRLARILVPCSLERRDDKALKYALDFAAACGAQATVLHASGAAGIGGAFLRLRRRVESLAGKARAGKIKLRVSTGDPKRAILEGAGEGMFDLIALGARRRRLLSRLILGSTAERVLRLSPIPVLCVPS